LSDMCYLEQTFLKQHVVYQLFVSFTANEI
jgi:hypothetical protein